MEVMQSLMVTASGGLSSQVLEVLEVLDRKIRTNEIKLVGWENRGQRQDELSSKHRSAAVAKRESEARHRNLMTTQGTGAGSFVIAFGQNES